VFRFLLRFVYTDTFPDDLGIDQQEVALQWLNIYLSWLTGIIWRG
jgi:hypothetical protein